jgi:hypothetical protein
LQSREADAAGLLLALTPPRADPTLSSVKFAEWKLQRIALANHYRFVNTRILHPSLKAKISLFPSLNEHR